MSVKVDERKWREYQRKVLRDTELRITTALPYAGVAADAAQAGFEASRVRTPDAQTIGAQVLDAIKVRCPVDTGALRESLTLEGGEDA